MNFLTVSAQATTGTKVPYLALPRGLRRSLSFLVKRSAAIDKGLAWREK
jgi:hypothetical protein